MVTNACGLRGLMRNAPPFHLSEAHARPHEHQQSGEDANSNFAAAKQMQPVMTSCLRGLMVKAPPSASSDVTWPLAQNSVPRGRCGFDPRRGYSVLGAQRQPELTTVEL